jgi:hypothetical protein
MVHMWVQPLFFLGPKNYQKVTQFSQKIQFKTFYAQKRQKISFFGKRLATYPSTTGYS